MTEKRDNLNYITKASEFIKLEEPEKFDFKRIMSGYYKTEDKRMPYSEEGESRLIHFLKYKTGDISPYIPFDCDGSNGTCDLSLDIWRTLLPWDPRDFRLHPEEIYQVIREEMHGEIPEKISGNAELLDGFPLGPDTMHTVASSLNDYMETRLGRRCSVRKISDYINGENGAEAGAELDDIFGELMEASGIVGNFVLVPYRFNGKRYGFTKDYWDLSLALLKNCTGEELNDLLGCPARYPIRWDKKLFPLYVNLMFLWEDVELKGEETAIRPLWEFNRELLEKREYTGESFQNIYNVNKTEEDYRRSVREETRRISRRSIFVPAMLKLALGAEGKLPLDDRRSGWKATAFYKKAVGKIFLNPVEIYSGYEDVISRIRRLAEEEKVLEAVGPVLDHALKKLSALTLKEC